MQLTLGSANYMGIPNCSSYIYYLFLLFTGNVFDGSEEGGMDTLNANQTLGGSASIGGSQSEEETSEEEDNDDDGECNEFTYQSDASFTGGQCHATEILNSLFMSACNVFRFENSRNIARC